MKDIIEYLNKHTDTSLDSLLPPQVVGAINEMQEKIDFMILIIVAGIGYYILTAPDNRSAGDKIGDAIDELPNGLDKAARQLEDRTPAEKLGDEMQDADTELKKSTNQQ
jgi:hypothetical protein